MERVMVFIDGSNLYKGVLEVAGRVGFNVKRVIDKLVQDRRLVRAYFFTAPRRPEDGMDEYRRQQGFLRALESIDQLQIAFGRLVRRGKPPNEYFMEKGVDVSLAVEMLKNAAQQHFDTAILVSGDGDYARLVQAVKDLGKMVEVACTDASRSDELRRVADRRITIDRTFLQDCWLS